VDSTIRTEFDTISEDVDDLLSDFQGFQTTLSDVESTVSTEVGGLVSVVGGLSNDFESFYSGWQLFLSDWTEFDTSWSSFLDTTVLNIQSQLTASVDAISSMESALADMSVDVEYMASQIATFSSEISGMEADIEAIATGLSPSGSFYAFMDDWFNSLDTSITSIFSSISDAEDTIVAEIGSAQAAIESSILSVQSNVLSAISDVENTIVAEIGGAQVAIETVIGNVQANILSRISDAEDTIVAQINSNEAKIDLLFDEEETWSRSILNTMHGQVESIEIDCPLGVGAAPCDGATQINVLGSPPLSGPKKVSLWVVAPTVSTADSFTVTAKVVWPQGEDTDNPNIRRDLNCTGSMWIAQISQEAVVDVMSWDRLTLLFDQLPVPCGIRLYVERTAGDPGNTDTLLFVLVVEEG
jgi:hypothetical protein